MRALLKAYPDFARLWTAHAVSSVGDVLYTVGVMVTVFERTGSALQAILVVLATMLPPFLFGPAAGVVVDRLPRRNVMIAMDLARAALVLPLAWLGAGPDAPVWPIYVVVALLAVGKTFHDPARLALVPTLVPRAELVRANALLTSTTMGAAAIGHALGALLVVTLGLTPVVLLDALTFLASALVLRGLPRPSRAGVLAPRAASLAGRGAEALRSAWRDAAEGLAYLRAPGRVRSLVTMEVLEWLPHGIWTSALMLAFTERALGGDTIWWGWQEAAFYVGMLFGSLLATSLAGWMDARAGRIIVLNAFLFTGLTLAYALSPGLAFAVFVCFLFGPPGAMRDVAQDALLQHSVPERMLGRVLTTRTMGTSLAFLIAAPIFAAAADRLPLRGIYLCGAFLYLLTALYAAFSPEIRRARIDS